MKKIILVILIFSNMISVKAQQIEFKAGKTISSFDYTNSKGNDLKNIQSTNHSFMSLGYRKNILLKKLYLNLNGNFNGYGAKGSDSALDNYFEWDLSYLGFGTGLDYEVYKPGNFTFFLKGSAAAEFIIQGTQSINNQVYKLPDGEDFNTPLYFLRAGLGIQYNVTNQCAVFTEYMYGRGHTFKDIQGDLIINTHNLGFGILINIAKDQTDSLKYGNVRIEQLEGELALSSLKIEELETNVAKVEVLEKELVEKEYDIKEKELEIQTKEKELVQKEIEIQVKEQEIKSLKEDISNALLPFNEEELNIHERGGKIYITMENDMLFQPGSWKIGPEGKNAIKALGHVLAENPDVKVLIEGHTDNTRFTGKGNIVNNWDLSTKRATTIVEILRKNKYIEPKNLTAAGKGEYDPVADNSTAEGRAQNRRIEVIITPKLDEVFKILKN